MKAQCLTAAKPKSKVKLVFNVLKKNQLVNV